MGQTKTCTNCEETKDFAEFGNQAAGKGGKLSTCKSCNRERNRLYREKRKGVLTFTTQKTNKTIQAFSKEIAGVIRKATHPDSNEVLYFMQEVSRDECRTAMANLKNVSRNKVSVQKV